MKSLAVACLLAASVGAQYDYKDNGASWPTDKIEWAGCNNPGGSPINLNTDLSGYTKHDFSDPITPDKYTGTYDNQKDVAVTLKDSTVQVKLSGSNMFTSEIGKTLLGAHTNTWNGESFEFKAKAEHTIDTKQHDVEFQSIFKAQDYSDARAFKFAGISIMFSVSDYNVKLSRAEEILVDTFFETMNLAKDGAYTVNLLTYGDFMSMIDMKNRWIYKGSLTTPPCTQAVYWNVLHAVYPIKRKHLEQITKKSKGTDAPEGNWRQFQTITADHKVAVVTETGLGSERDTANDINYNININIYNQNVGGQCGAQ